jgi:hypothetical protein
MQRWEYKQTVIPGNVATKANLDELGAQGWELVGVFMRYIGGWETIFFFKRPIESAKPSNASRRGPGEAVSDRPA